MEVWQNMLLLIKMIRQELMDFSSEYALLSSFMLMIYSWTNLVDVNLIKPSGFTAAIQMRPVIIHSMTQRRDFSKKSPLKPLKERKR